MPADTRLTPFEIAYGTLAEERFPAIRESLKVTGRDPHDADSFVLDREVAALLRDLVPEEGVGEAVREHLALLHYAYLYWLEGGWLFRLSRRRARTLLAAPFEPAETSGAPRAYYVQFPERLIWGELEPGEPHEPLDGLFVRPWPEGGYFVLAVFGLHPAREGFTVVEVDGHREEGAARENGSPLFAPVLPGGEAAGLYSVVHREELIELAARTVPLAAAATGARGTPRPHQPIEID